MNKWNAAILITAIIPTVALAGSADVSSFSVLSESLIDDMLPTLKTLGFAMFIISFPVAIVSNRLSTIFMAFPFIFVPNILELLLGRDSVFHEKPVSSIDGDHDLSDKLSSKTQ
ncbi:hypothetical protein [Vibrio sp. 10N.239.312.D08]|uniref:hypothetical protein n=1 Tax=Vibrio sp. 10N.239.312.D08 TaxID=3229978 RepID=UPI0035513370